MLDYEACSSSNVQSSVDIFIALSLPSSLLMLLNALLEPPRLLFLCGLFTWSVLSCPCGSDCAIWMEDKGRDEPGESERQEGASQRRMRLILTNGIQDACETYRWTPIIQSLYCPYVTAHRLMSSWAEIMPHMIPITSQTKTLAV